MLKRFRKQLVEPVDAGELHPNDLRARLLAIRDELSLLANTRSNHAIGALLGRVEDKQAIAQIDVKTRLLDAERQTIRDALAVMRESEQAEPEEQTEAQRQQQIELKRGYLNKQIPIWAPRLASLVREQYEALAHQLHVLDGEDTDELQFALWEGGPLPGMPTNHDGNPVGVANIARTQAEKMVGHLCVFKRRTRISEHVTRYQDVTDPELLHEFVTALLNASELPELPGDPKAFVQMYLIEVVAPPTASAELHLAPARPRRKFPRL